MNGILAVGSSAWLGSTVGFIIMVSFAALAYWWSGRWSMVTRLRALVAIMMVQILMALASIYLHFCPTTANKDSDQPSSPPQSQSESLGGTNDWHADSRQSPHGDAAPSLLPQSAPCADAAPLQQTSAGNVESKYNPNTHPDRKSTRLNSS